MRLDVLLLLFAPSGPNAGRGMTIFFIQMLAFIAIIYFLMIRPKIQQEKKHKARIAAIKRGDQIVTAGGIVAEVIHIKDDRLTVKSGESRIVVQRDRVADIVNPTPNIQPHTARRSRLRGSTEKKNRT